jgi:nucleotide-binding universal stress UspA family protein
MAVLVASDLTHRSDRAIARGRIVAEALGTGLHVLHVVDERQPAAIVDHATAWAREALQRECAAHAPSAMVHVVVGDARRRIGEEASALGCRLIVLGLHDAGKDGPFSFGDTTARHVVATSRRPVLLVRDEPAGPYVRAVVGVDFSLHGRVAIEEAHRLFPGTALTLVHAYPVPFRDMIEDPDYRADIRAEEKRKFDAFLAGEIGWLLERVTRAGVPPRILDTVLEEGRPVDVLRAACEAKGADLLVVGTHGAGVIERMLWGSVARELLDDPPRDVLIVDAARRGG